MVDKQKQMIDIMLKELKHIPNRSRPQRELRKVYSRNRMRSLGKKADMPKTRKEVLEESISELVGEYPDFKFEYDQEFFNKAD